MKKKPAKVILIAILIVFVAYIKDQVNDGQKRSPLVRYILEDHTVKERIPIAGSPWTDFCPEIPSGLYFEDSTESLKEKMGAPAGTVHVSNKTYILIYKSSKNYGFEYAYFYFVFTNNFLEGINIVYETPVKIDEDQRDFNEARSTLTSSLISCLGEPVDSFDYDRAEEVAKVLYSWEYEKNIVFLLLQLNSDNLLTMTVSILPRSLADHYREYFQSL